MRYFQNLKLKHKIIFSFLLVLFFSLVLVAIAMNTFFTRSTTQMANQYTMQGIQQVNGSIDSNLSSVSTLVDILSTDSDVIEFLLWDHYLDTAAGLYTRSNIRNLMTSLSQSVDIIQGVVLVNAGDFYISQEMYHDAPTPIIDDDWYRQCAATGGMILFRPGDNRKLKYFDSKATSDLVTLAKPLYLPKSNEPAGAVLIDLHVGFLRQITEGISWDKTGFVLVMDEKHNMIYAPDNDVPPRVRSEWFSQNEGVFQKKINGQDYEFVYQVSRLTGWTAVGVFSSKKALKPIANFRWFIVVILLVAALFAIVTVNQLSRTIVRPILALNRLMQKAVKHEYSVHFPAEYEDEIGELAESFNTMADETRTLISLVKNEQRQKRKAELQILQEQIKPHFLYNTFDTIHWIAKGYGATEVIAIIRSLTTFFRVGLSRGREEITVREEIDHVVSYLTIQQYRYQDKLHYRLEVDHSCEGYYVQKLILQPLVENAIYHGLKNRDDRPGRLLVQVRKKQHALVLAVTDNGVGIQARRMEEILSALNRDGGESSIFGLRNVHERIRISYGQEYGLRIASRVGCYTRMEIWHPLLNSAQEVSSNE